jgi:hypothetical protein
MSKSIVVKCIDDARDTFSRDPIYYSKVNGVKKGYVYLASVAGNGMLAVQIGEHVYHIRSNRFEEADPIRLVRARFNTKLSHKLTRNNTYTAYQVTRARACQTKYAVITDDGKLSHVPYDFFDPIPKSNY